MVLKEQNWMGRGNRGQSVLRGAESVMVGSTEESVAMKLRGASDGVEERRV